MNKSLSSERTVCTYLGTYLRIKNKLEGYFLMKILVQIDIPNVLQFYYE